MVVISAAFLGFFVGLIVSTMVTAQFYLFIEQPLDLEIPGWLLFIMLIISLLTTFIAVYVPITKVNR